MKSDFCAVMTAVRPLMQGTRDLGLFTANLIDMGLKPDETADGDGMALSLRAKASWKGYANGSANLSKTVASELVSRWDSFRFAENLLAAHEEPALNALAGKLHVLDGSINRGDVGQGLGVLLFKIFEAAAGASPSNSGLTVSITSASGPGVEPYIDAASQRLRLGDLSIGLPRKKSVPAQVQDVEVGYVTALVNAYCEDRFRAGEQLTLDDIPEHLSTHFHEQRKAFYSAEWVRETSWSCIDNGKAVFDEFLEAIYVGVCDMVLRSYPSARERLLATLAQSTQVQLDRLRLNQIIDLIDGWSRKGSCHELVAQQRIKWVDA